MLGFSCTSRLTCNMWRLVCLYGLPEAARVERLLHELCLVLPNAPGELPPSSRHWKAVLTARPLAPMHLSCEYVVPLTFNSPGSYRDHRKLVRKERTVTHDVLT